MGLDTLFVLSLISTEILTEIVFSLMAVEMGPKICAGPNLCNVNIFRPPQGIPMNSKKFVVDNLGGGGAW